LATCAGSAALARDAASLHAAWTACPLLSPATLTWAPRLPAQPKSQASCFVAAKEEPTRFPNRQRVFEPALLTRPAGMKMLQLNRHNVQQFRSRDPKFPDVPGGILLPQVYPGSPADKAGLKAGDIIIGA
jgi:hypothetical protein